MRRGQIFLAANELNFFDRDARRYGKYSMQAFSLSLSFCIDCTSRRNDCKFPAECILYKYEAAVLRRDSWKNWNKSLCHLVGNGLAKLTVVWVFDEFFTFLDWFGTLPGQLGGLPRNLH
jgi:hypothetical protein